MTPFEAAKYLGQAFEVKYTNPNGTEVHLRTARLLGFIPAQQYYGGLKVLYGTDRVEAVFEFISTDNKIYSGEAGYGQAAADLEGRVVRTP